MSDEVEIKDPKAVLDALERAKADAKKYREELEALQKEVEPLREQVETFNKERKDNAIKSALVAEGVDPDRILKFLKVDEIDFKDGKLEGFDKSFGALKEDLPELFDPKKRVGGRVEMENTGDIQVEKSVSELQAEKILSMR